MLKNKGASQAEIMPSRIKTNIKPQFPSPQRSHYLNAMFAAALLI
jgi:hypothetical protein